MKNTKEDHLSSIVNTLKNSGLPENLFARCFWVYFFISAVNILIARHNNINAISGWQNFIQAYPLIMVLVEEIIVFVIFSAILGCINAMSSKEKPTAKQLDSIMLIVSSLFFSCALMWRNSDIYVCIGVCLTSAVFVVYGASKLNTEFFEKLSARSVAIVVGALAVIITAFVCVTSVFRNLTFNTTCFDMGIFAQMFHSLAHNFTADTTCERDVLMSHFNIHASYIFYLLIPVYAMFPSINTLLIAQVIMSVSGIIPLYLIAKKRDFKGIGLLSVCVIYLFSVGILAPCYYDFHENAFLPPLLLWLLYAMEKRNYKLFFIMSALVCIVKEDAPLYVMCIALYLAIEERGRSRLYPLAALFASFAYFLFITSWLGEHGDGSMMMSTRFGNLTVNKDEGFIGIIGNVLSNPGYFISLFISENSLIFFIEMLLPLLFLPFMTKKIHRYLLMIPFIIMNLVIGAGYSYASIMGYQYTFGTAPLLIYLTIINLQDFKAERRNIISVTAAALSVIMAFSLVSVKVNYVETYKNNAVKYQTIAQYLDAIPSDACVMSNTGYLPQVADRDEVYQLSDNDFIKSGDNVVGIKDMEKYDFYILSRLDEKTGYAEPYLKSAGYKVFAEYTGAVVIYASPNYSTIS